MSQPTTACGRARSTALTFGSAIAGSRTVNVTALPRPRALARLALPALQLGEAPHEREADPETPVRAVELALALHEELERARGEIGSHADAFVDDTQHGLVAFARHAHADGFAGRRVADRVREKIHDDLLDARDVAVHPHRAEVALESVAVELARVLERRDRALRLSREIDRRAVEDDLAESRRARHPGDRPRGG